MNTIHNKKIKSYCIGIVGIFLVTFVLIGFSSQLISRVDAQNNDPEGNANADAAAAAESAANAPADVGVLSGLLGVTTESQLTGSKSPNFDPGGCSDCPGGTLGGAGLAACPNSGFAGGDPGGIITDPTVFIIGTCPSGTYEIYNSWSIIPPGVPLNQTINTFSAQLVGAFDRMTYALISSRVWTQVSGPSQATITQDPGEYPIDGDTGLVKAAVSDLVPGTYRFVLVINAPGYCPTLVGGDATITVASPAAAAPPGTTFQWTNTVRPAGAPTPTITGATTLTPSFGTLTSLGTYTFQLTGTDGTTGLSVSDTMNVVVGTPAAVCTGTLPANTLVYSGDYSGLSVSTLFTHSTFNSAAKCEFSCTAGTWNSTTQTCVVPDPVCPPACLDGDTVIIDVNDNGVVDNNGIADANDIVIVISDVDDGINDTGKGPTLTANPSTVTSGEKSTLEWDLNGHTGCVLTGGVLPVPVPIPDSGGNPPDMIGSMEVTILDETTFTLNCASGGSDTATVRVRSSVFET